MFVGVQDPGEKSQVFVPRRGGVGAENVENFPGGGGQSRLNVQIFTSVYEFLATVRQKSKFWTLGSSHAPPRPDFTHQTPSGQTKRRGLVPAF